MRTNRTFVLVSSRKAALAQRAAVDEVSIGVRATRPASRSRAASMEASATTWLVVSAVDIGASMAARVAGGLVRATVSG